MAYILGYGDKTIKVPSFAEHQIIGKDSGWIDLPLSSYFQSYADSWKPRYRKIGKMVEITGAVKPSKELTFTSSSNNYTISNIPEEFRTKEQFVMVCQGSGVYLWTLVVRTDGDLRIERNRNGSGEYVNLSTSSWLPFHVFYFID